ncbi:MAG: type VI secretion system baseplate subunit TssG, partial [Polyangiales bacterium]
MAGRDRTASPAVSAAPLSEAAPSPAPVPANDQLRPQPTAASVFAELTGRSLTPTEARAGALLDALALEPYAFDFYQALRRLECVFRELPRTGEGQRPSDEPIRFAQAPTLMAAPTTVAGFEPATERRPARLLQYFFGLLGPNGALPLHLTDHARQRVHHHRDQTLTRFLDLFHHRLLALFYRAWSSAQPTVQHDRPEQDQFAGYVGALFGIGLPSLRGRDALPDHVKLYYAGLLSGQSRSAAGLKSLVAGVMHMPTALEELVGEWIVIGPEQRWQLGDRPSRHAPVLMGRLGQSCVVGSRVWSRQHRFRIVLGPLRREQFRWLLPGGGGLPLLTALVRSYLGDEWRWDVRLVLERAHVRPL